VDWHSSVHGTFALFAVSRLTGEPEFRAAALAAIGDPRSIESEVDDVRSGRLAEELPYGFAWALQLNVEAGRCGVTLFHDLGVAARDQLVPYLAGEDDLLCPTYRSPLWAAYCLHRWATAFDDAPARATAENFAARVLPRCGDVAVGNGFLSPSHLAVLLAMQTGLPAHTVAQALAAVRTTEVLDPGRITTAYRAGLNFSRAWGSYAAWLLTGDPAYRDMFATLVATHIQQPEYWADDYRRHGHWVPQFGVFAIHLTEALRGS
jgi:hypothetical protein